MLLGCLCNQIPAEIKLHASNTSIIDVAGQIAIGEIDQVLILMPSPIHQPITNGAIHIPENLLDCLVMHGSRFLHITAYHPHGIREIWMGVSQIP